MNLFGILIYVNVNVINPVMLEYLDYEDCKCKKRLTDNVVEECSENINGKEIIYNATLNDHGKVCNSCTIYIVLLFIAF